MTSGNARVALITGGGSGIGRATGRMLRGAGYRVGLLDVDHRMLAEHWDGVEGSEFRECDVSDRSSVTAAVTALAAGLGPPSVLVNSAGIYRAAPILDVTDDDFDALFAVNVRGTFLTSQVVARLMAATGQDGAIVNVSSVAAYESTDVNGAYAATKGAISALTRAMAVSLASHGIRVNAVAPGPIATPMGAEATTDPALEARMLRRVLSGRFATPDDVARAITYLASADSAYVTGHILNVDGGILANR